MKIDNTQNYSMSGVGFKLSTVQFPGSFSDYEAIRGIIQMKFYLLPFVESFQHSDFCYFENSVLVKLSYQNINASDSMGLVLDIL